MTWPEDTLRSTPAPKPRKAPSLAVGYLLNVLLPGAGFTYVGLVGWHVGWVGILIALNLLGSVLVGVTSSPVFGLLPFLGWVTQLVHFGRTYAARAERNFQPDLDSGMKIGLIAGHAVLNFLLVGVLTAVLIPNLLGARTRANDAGERAAAHSAYMAAVTAQLDGKLLDGPCPLEDVPGNERITRCTVSNADTEEPQINVTFDSGHTLRLP
ncbi:hypothetical protein [Deinococcus knuensis]|nr:hypothetical protein [Deinococcus knuensis]